MIQCFLYITFQKQTEIHITNLGNEKKIIDFDLKIIVHKH